MNLIKDFFTLRVADPNGHMYDADWKTKLRWIRAGCPHPNYKKMHRLCRMRRHKLKKMREERKSI